MSSAKREDDGMQLLGEAEKKLKAKGGFFKSLFGSSSSAAEEAAELYVKAGNQFKLAKAWKKAGDAFALAAATYEQTSDMQYEAASKYVDAAKALKNVDDGQAVAMYENAIRLHTDGSRFQQCARFTKEVAEILENKGDLAAARDAYAAAADFYDGEDAQSSANTMRLKVATLSAKVGECDRAAKLFEQSASYALDSNLLRYSARGYMLCAGICRCAAAEFDPIGTQRALDGYREMDHSFPESREDELLQGIVTAKIEGDVEAFTNAVYKFDSISKLDEWKTTLLLKVKKSIGDAEDDLT